VNYCNDLPACFAQQCTKKENVTFYIHAVTFAPYERSGQKQFAIQQWRQKGNSETEETQVSSDEHQ
jgi:hypothetical protein